MKSNPGLNNRMQTMLLIPLDDYGRIVVPKGIREKMKSKEVVFIYDEKNEDVHMIPIKDIAKWVGRFRGASKNFLEEHEEDWNDPYRR